MNGLQPTLPLRELPADQLSSPEAAARDTAELAAAKARETAAAALAQKKADARLEELFEELRSLPRIILKWYPGASIPGDIPSENRVRLVGALDKWLHKFIQDLRRDS